MPPTTTRTRPRSLSAELPSDLSAALVARRLVDDLFDSCALDPEVVHDFGLVTHELVTNAVLHGSPTPGDTIALFCALEPRHLVVSVHDAGCAGDVVAREFSDERPSGRGLVLVEGLSESWSVDRSAGTTVTARLAA